MKYFFLGMLFCFFASCNLIFEDDLKKQKVELLSPPDGYTSAVQTQTFVWDSLPRINQYRFQLVSKRFDFIEDYVLDTVLIGRKITLVLTARAYQWRVIAINNSSQTDYYTYNLQIGQDTVLTNQLVYIVAPDPNAVSHTDSVAFLWTRLALADQYQLQIATSPSFNSQTIKKDTTTSQDYLYLVNELGVGTFYYRIRAIRTGRDTTAFTTTRQVGIDRKPIHSIPINNSTQSVPLTISWQRASGVIKDSLFLYHNSTASSYQQLELFANNYTFVNSDTAGYGAGTYYWQVKSVGSNGIQSGRSDLWKFTIN